MVITTVICLILGVLGVFILGYSCGKHEANKRKQKEIDIATDVLRSKPETKEQEKTNQNPIKPCMQTIKQKAKQFMTTQEIKDLGLDPFMETAGAWRKVAPSWVPEHIPDEARVASFAVSSPNDNSIIESIIIWNTDTFDYEAYLNTVQTK